jgi:hypothetical protein
MPFWKSAIVLLGRIGDRSAVPLIADVLEDSSANIDTCITAVRALGRIGDRSAVPKLIRFLERIKQGDLSMTRKLGSDSSISGKQDEPGFEDAQWQVELATAETLEKIGKPQKEIIDKYLKNDRSYVRLYAAKLKK